MYEPFHVRREVNNKTHDKQIKSHLAGIYVNSETPEDHHNKANFESLSVIGLIGLHGTPQAK